MSIKNFVAGFGMTILVIIGLAQNASAVTVEVKNAEQWAGNVTYLPDTIRPRFVFKRTSSEPLNQNADVPFSFPTGSGMALPERIIFRYNNGGTVFEFKVASTGYWSYRLAGSTTWMTTTAPQSTPFPVRIPANVDSADMDLVCLPYNSNYNPPLDNKVSIIVSGTQYSPIDFYANQISVYAQKLDHTGHIGSSAVSPGDTVRFVVWRDWVGNNGYSSVTANYSYQINNLSAASGAVQIGNATSSTTSGYGSATVDVPIGSGVANGRLLFDIQPDSTYARGLAVSPYSPVNTYEIPLKPYREIVVIGGLVDSDFDGLTDYDEIALHNTDPDKYSTDGDIMSDGFEVRAGGTGDFDPLVAKTFTTAELNTTQPDGLTLLQAIRYNTNPNASGGDSDGDGVTDGDEVARGTDPMDASDHSDAPLSSDEYQEVTLNVGDHSASHSERYVLQVGNINHQASTFGDMSGLTTYKFRIGKTYPIRLIYAGGTGADYDWTASLGVGSGAVLTGDYRDILKVQGAADDSDPANATFAAKGKFGYLTTEGGTTPLQMEMLNPEQCQQDYWQDSSGNQMDAPSDDKKLYIVIRRGFGDSAASSRDCYLHFSGTAIPNTQYKIESPSGITIPTTGANPGTIKVTIPAGEDLVLLRIRLLNEASDVCGGRWGWYDPPTYSAPPYYTLQADLADTLGGTTVASASAELYQWKVSIAKSTSTMAAGSTASFKLWRSSNGSCFPGTPPAVLPLDVYYSYSFDGITWTSPTQPASFGSGSYEASVSIPIPATPADGILRVRIEPSRANPKEYARAVKSFYNSAQSGYIESTLNPSEAVVAYGSGSTIDTDGDGLSDYDELTLYGTNPDYFDTDGDLLPDKYEVDHLDAGLDPLIPNNLASDTDGDGMNLFDEMTYGSDPNNPDTDGDGKTDGEEKNNGTDPTDGQDFTPPTAAELAFVRLTVGDDSGSQSERYILKLGNISHQSQAFGSVVTRDYLVRRGKTYNFSLKHVATDEENNIPDLDWVAGIEVLSDDNGQPGQAISAAEITDATPNAILGSHTSADPFPTTSGTLLIPLDASYYHLSLVPDRIKANGKGTAQAVLDPSSDGATWSIVETGDAALGCTIDQSGKVACTGFKAGTVTVRATIGSIVKEATLRVICDVSCADGDCTEGGGTVRNGSVDYMVSLGKVDYGQTPVNLRVKESILAEAIVPSSIKITAESPQIETYPAAGTIEQVRTPSILAWVTDITSSGYAIKLYYASDFAGMNLPIDIASSGTQPFSTWTIDNTDTSHVLVTETRGTLVRKYLYEYLGSSDGHYSWDLKTEWSGTDYTREDRRVYTVDSVGKDVETYTIQDISVSPSVMLVSEKRTYNTSSDYPPNALLKEEIGTSAAATTSYAYYDETAPVGSRGQVKTKQGPTGWEMYYYDGFGRKTRIVSQSNDNPLPADTASEDLNRVTTITYPVGESQLENTLVKMYSTELSAPVEVSHTMKQVSQEDIGGTVYDVEDRIECQSQGVTSPNASDNLHTKTYTYPVGNPWAFRTRKIINADGTLELYDYQEDSVAKTLQTTIWKGAPNNDFSQVVDGTRTVETVDQAGNFRGLLVYDIVNNTTPVADTEIDPSSLDEMGRPTKFIYDDGSTSFAQYGCCGLDSLTDRAGVQATYLYDFGKRLEYEVGPDITLHYVHDAAGRLDYIERMKTSDQSVSVRLKDYDYDDGGRITSLAEPMQNPGDTIGTTHYDLSTDGSGHRVMTTTYPNQSTKREVFALNGKLIRVDGTAVHPIKYEYGADGDGEYVKEIHIQGTTGNESTAEWVKRSYDMLGRLWKTTYPSFNGGPESHVTRQFSTTTGKLISTTDQDGVVTLMQYNEKGDLSREAVDMNQDGTIEEGIDQVSDYDNSWVSWTPPGAGSAIMAKQTVSSDWDAGSVAIANHSFEATVLGDGASSATVSGWTVTGTAGVINPSSSQYPLNVLNSIDGNNVAFLGSSSAYGDISLGNLGSIVANRQYRLKLQLGHRSSGSFPGTVTINLKSGSTVLQSLTAPAVAAGSFQSVELVYFVPAGSPNIGQQLGVEIASTGNGIVDVDNVEILTSDRVPTVTSVASGNGSYSSVTENGLTTTYHVTYTPGEYKMTETVTRPDTSKIISDYINDRQYSLTVQANGADLAYTEYQYDDLGRVNDVSETRSGSSKTTSYTYYKDGRVASETSPVPGLGNSTRLTTSYFYNDFVLDGPTRTVQYPDTTTAITKFYLTGEPKKVSGSKTTPAEYTYDDQGRQKIITTWRDLSTDTTKANTEEVTEFTYDPNRGFMTSKTINGQPFVSYDYYDSGRVKTRTWARGVVTSYIYNNAGDLKSVDYSDIPGGPEVTYDYDSRGRLKTVTDPTDTHTYTYSDGQLQQELHSGGVLDGLSMNWGYDAYNRPQTITAKAGSTTLFNQGFGYKSGSSLLDYVSLNDSGYVTYDYEPGTTLPQTINYRQGSSTATPLFSTTENHDALNRLRYLTHTLAQLPSYDIGYNTLSQEKSVLFGDNSHWDYGYDGNGQLQTAKKTWADSTPVAGQQFEYYYDQAGNRTKTVRDGQDGASRQANYSANNYNRYDSRAVPAYVNVIGSAHPLATVTVNDAPSERHDYYFRSEVPVTSGSDVTLTIRGVRYDYSANRDVMTTASFTKNVPPASQSFTYVDGNMTQDGVWTYTWDGENRLVGMVRPNNIRLTFKYDYAGRRVEKIVEHWNGSAYGSPEVTRFLYDGWHLVAELTDANTLVRGYVWGLTSGGNLDPQAGLGSLAMVWDASSSSLHYVTQDGSGNVAALVNSSGAIDAQYEYAPFGEPIQASGPAASSCPIRYSNRYWDSETSLVYYGHRYYSPSLGRWLNPDPLGELGGENLYDFVLNSPLIYSDPLGLYTFAEYMQIAGAGVYGGVVTGGGNVGKAIKGVTYDPIAGVSSLAGTASTPYGREDLANRVKTAARLAWLFKNNRCVRDTLLSELGDKAKDMFTDPDKLSELLANAGVALGTLGYGAVADSASGAGKMAKVLEALDKILPDGIRSLRNGERFGSAVKDSYAPGELMPNGEIAGFGPGAASSKEFSLPGRSGALNQAKRDLGIPRSTAPDSVDRVPMTDMNGHWIMGKDGRPIMTRQYTYTRPDGSKVIIQDHSAGHDFGGVGNQGSHFNVRPPENPRTGKVPGTQPHYPFN